MQCKVNVFSFDEQIWINTELEQKRKLDKGDVELIVSNYKDNTFLPQTLVDEIEYLQETDPEFWKIYGLGEYGNITGLIMESSVIESIPDNADLIEQICKARIIRLKQTIETLESKVNLKGLEGNLIFQF